MNLTSPEISAGDATTLPSVSILLPAWNEADMIERCLDSLLAIRWPELEIVVCAGGADDTLEIANRYVSDRVIVLEQKPGEGKQRALRRCFVQSVGEILYFTDADCIVNDAAFKAVISPITSGKFMAATGASMPLPDQLRIPFVRYQWGQDFHGSLRLREVANGFNGRHCAIRREVVDNLRIFDDDVVSGTDYHMTRRVHHAGLQIAWTNSFVLSEYPSGARSYVRMWRRWIKNVLVRGVRTRSYREVASSSIGIGIGGAVLCLPILATFTHRALFLPWTLLMIALSSTRLRAHRKSVDARMSEPLRSSALRVPGYVVLEAFARVAGLVAAVIPEMRNSW